MRITSADLLEPVRDFDTGEIAAAAAQSSAAHLSQARSSDDGPIF